MVSLKKPRRPRPPGRKPKPPNPFFDEPLPNSEPLWDGSPFRRTFGTGRESFPLTSSPIGYDVEIVRDSCNIGVRFTPELGFFRMPPIEITYRNPNCRETEVNPLPPIDLPDPPPEPPDWPGGPYDPGLFVEVITSRPVRRAQAFPTPAGGAECIHAWMPQNQLASLTGATIAPDRISPDGRLIYRDLGYGFAIYTNESGGAGRYLGYSRSNGTVSNEYGTFDFYQRFDPGSDALLFVRWKILGGQGLPYIVSPTGHWTRTETTWGRGHQWWIRYRADNVEESISYQTAPIGRYRGTVANLTAFLTASPPVSILGIYDGGSCVLIPPKIEPPPIPPGTMPETPCDDRLLRAILAKLERIERTLAAPEFFTIKGDQPTGVVEPKPAKELPKAPERLIYPKRTGDKKQIGIPNLLSLGEFLIRQIDRAVGALPFTAKVADGDPSEEGDQSVEVEVLSIADALKQLVQGEIEIRGDGEVNQILIHRTLQEIGAVHLGAVKTLSLVDAIAEYLDFKTYSKIEKVPFYFDPTAGIARSSGFGSIVIDGETGEQKPTTPILGDDAANLNKLLPEILKPTLQAIRVTEWDKSEKRSHNDIIQDILKNAMVAAAGAGEPATPERLEQLLLLARAVIKLENAQQVGNIQQALSSGQLTRKRQ